MDVARIIVKPDTVATTLLKVKSELERLLLIIRDWREEGINGTGVIPISVLPLEDKLKKSIADIEQMITLASKI